MASSSTQVLLCLALCGLVAATAAAPTPILSYAYDNFRTGFAVDDILIKNNVQTLLTLQRSLPTPARVSAQPLYVPGLTIGGTVHNIVYIATESAEVLAYDADTGGPPLWTKDVLALSGNTPAPNNRGITGTPVIDIANNIIYVVAAGKTTLGAQQFRLHGLDLLTGAERGSNVIVQPSPTPSFDPSKLLQRAGLALQAGTVYIAFGGGQTGQSGWLLSYDTTTSPYSLKGQLATSPTGGGVWMSAAAPTIINGDVYIATGNDAKTGVVPGRPATFSQGTLRIAGNNLNAVSDYFIAGDALQRNQNNDDFGASGVVYAEDQRVILQGTKGEGGNAALYVLDPTNLGGGNGMSSTRLTGTSDGNAKWREPLATGQLRGNPAYWHSGGSSPSSSLFVHPEGNQLLKYKVESNKLTKIATAGVPASPPAFAGGPGFSTVVSAATVGAAEGLVWDLDTTSSPSTLYVYDATTLSPVTNLGSGCKSADLFAIPAVAGGHVFVACDNGVAVFGLKKVATTGTVTVAPTARTITTLCAVGHPETITATIQPNPPPGPSTAPTGTVTFTLDLTGNDELISLNGGSPTLALGTGALVTTTGTNVATASVTPTSASGAAIWTHLPAATYKITATYGSDANYIGTAASGTFEVDHLCHGF